jgi:hypothetical protein
MVTDTVRPLPQQFKRDGFNFRLIQRAGPIAMFAKTKPRWTREFWEVVKVQSLPAMKLPGGRVCPPHEAMPCPEDWGVNGWSYSDLPSAEAKYASLLECPKNTLTSA